MEYLISIFVYVGTAYGLMCISQSCGLKNSWLAWIPFANVYQLGLVADHYMERNEKCTTNQRTKLLVLYIIYSLVAVICIGALFVGLFAFFGEMGVDFWRLMSDAYDYEDEMTAIMTQYVEGMTEEAILTWLGDLLASVLIPLLIMVAGAIVYAVFRFIALYRIYKLMDPSHATVYTVLSILFNIAAPIIFLIIAKKQPVYPDEGPFFGDTGSYDSGFGGGTGSFNNTPDNDAGSDTYSI